MDVRQVIGILVILGAYGLTWFFLLRSLRIVKIIDREGLDHAGEIKARLKLKRSAAASAGPGGSDGPNHTGQRSDSDSTKK
jgi:hypothetical protein